MERDGISGLEAEFLASRGRLLRFLQARGAGDAAEDLLQDIWLKASAASGPVAAPLPYLFRVANSLMIDRYRAQRQAQQRDHDWADAQDGAMPGVSDEPSPERALIARQQAARVAQTIDSLGPRAATIFRRHRIDGMPQKQVAQEMGVSLSTVEADLRMAYRALADLKGALE